MPNTTDFIIVGGGVYGAATALELAERDASVTLLERDRIACGASGGLGKRGVRANGRDPRELPLMRDAYERWPNLSARLEADTGYVRTGHLEIYERERDLGLAQARQRAQASLGIPTETLNVDAARAIEPSLTTDIRLAVHAPLDGVSDHTATTRGYAAAAARAGAEIHEGVEVARLLNDKLGVEQSDGTVLEAKRGVLVLANASTPALLEAAFALALPVWSMLPQVMRTDALSEPIVMGLIGHAHRVLSVKALPDNAVMVSGGWRGKWNDALGRGEPVAEQVEGNWAEALAVLPALAAHEITEVSTERLETCSLDGVPIIDRVEGHEDVIYACGWCGHGWAIAPSVAPLLAAWALDGGKMPDLLAPFSNARFRG